MYIVKTSLNPLKYSAVITPSFSSSLSAERICCKTARARSPRSWLYLRAKPDCYLAILAITFSKIASASTTTVNLENHALDYIAVPILKSWPSEFSDHR